MVSMTRQAISKRALIRLDGSEGESVLMYGIV
jgi:hypothetical protein